MDFDSLIGLEVNEAKEILNKNNFYDIEVIMNAKEDDKCNITLVCSCQNKNNHIKLICGNFYIIQD